MSHSQTMELDYVQSGLSHSLPRSIDPSLHHRSYVGATINLPSMKNSTADNIHCQKRLTIARNKLCIATDRLGIPIHLTKHAVNILCRSICKTQKNRSVYIAHSRLRQIENQIHVLKIKFCCGAGNLRGGTLSARKICQKFLTDISHVKPQAPFVPSCLVSGQSLCHFNFGQVTCG